MKPQRIFLTVLLATILLSAQNNPGQQLHQALVLNQQGNFAGAVKIAKSIVDSNQLSGIELGRAYIILGFAYRGEQKFMEARAAFENSLRILERDPADQGDYAAALNNFAGLYADFGQFQIAGTMWQKALSSYQAAGNHAAVVQSLTNLAGLALTQRQSRLAEKYLDRASTEIKLAHDPDEDDLVVFFETQAWLALEQKNSSAAVAGYQRAFEICNRVRGTQHWLTGWEQTLLGNAYARSGDVTHGLAGMRQGLGVMRRTLRGNNPKYFTAEMAYSRALDQSGSHLEAARVKKSAERDSKDFHGAQCAGCTISVAGFR